MNSWLITLAFGPVQGFIASARRSRDLWAGSFMLSEIARAAAKALKDGGATLIYPAPGRVEHEDAEENSNLSNMILAEVAAPDAAAAAALCDRAKRAAQDQLARFSRQALQEWSSVDVREDLWHRQVEVALEKYAAWSQIQNNDYRSAYDAAKSALAARKNTRDFAPLYVDLAHQKMAAGVPKSSLDGANESVLPKERKHFPAKFGLSPGEQLDAIGCIKRVVGRAERFTAMTRMAAHPWLTALPEEAIKALRQAYEPLVGLELSTRCEGNAGAYSRFPFDAGLLFPERLQQAISQATAGAQEAARKALLNLQHALKSITPRHGSPNPYMALVVADGDRMGTFIDQARTAEEHSEISAAVAAFADRVPKVARDHGGHCLFNGGEDLTVLFPLDGVVNGARSLARAFDEQMKGLIERFVGAARMNPDDAPSLRVGAAICHVLEPMGVIRQRADLAEKFAKGEAGVTGQGNALGLQLHVRAGHVIQIRFRFDDESAFRSLDRWMAAYDEGHFPARVAYDTRAAGVFQLQLLKGDPVQETQEHARAMALAEFKRLLTRANESGGGKSVSEENVSVLLRREQELQESVDESTPHGLLSLGDELILSRWLSARSATGLFEQGRA